MTTPQGRRLPEGPVDPFWTEPGQLHYRSLRGDTHHWLGPDPWRADQAPPIADLDLLNLRALCVQTLRKVENELDHRGLLNRVTPTASTP